MRIIFILVCILCTFFYSSCSDIFLEDPEHSIPVFLEEPKKTDEVIEVSPAISFSEYEKKCIRTEYYFCPGVSGPLMRIKITKDICKVPPEIISMSECEEYLECDPHEYIIDTYSCITQSGKDGLYTVYCDKGFIKDGNCKEDETVSDISVTEQDICSVTDVIAEEDILQTAAIPSIDLGPSDTENICELTEIDVMFIIDTSASMIGIIDNIIFAVKKMIEKESNLNNIHWGLIVAPLNNGLSPGNKNYLYMIRNLQDNLSFDGGLSLIMVEEMIGQYEMSYDAVYLSLRDISLFAPYDEGELVWPTWIGNVLDESVPPIEDFVVDWRVLSKKIVVIFTDEVGQSFLMPQSKIGQSYNTNSTITQSKLLKMILDIDKMEIHTFTTIECKEGEKGWKPLSDASGGKWNLLKSNADYLFEKLDQILNK
jgi:hypothetical protein